MVQRGALIVFEGLDRSGKTTQVDRLIARLQKEGRKARLQKFPDRTTGIGKMIDAYLQSKAEMDDHAIHLLFSANRWECVSSILASLDAGESVVVDRYAFSGLAFSAAKGLDFGYCQAPDVGLPLPDLTLYLTLSPEVAAQRGAYGQERYENVELQKEVRRQFAAVFDDLRRKHGQERMVEVSAEGTLDEVEEAIWAEAQRALDPVEPIGTLWTQ
ncbi:hypothetical protein A1Q2_00077 [Trichosporon asahii var. asahii CBS 8904]|uniref:Thymidylate kinase n=1 Tax=Trichosporon asahii var. asahii (strain CBS 8904) TaxID=1220162 RepID=K1W1B3_TRIAC|nr:hypothetical protein A1Q2_00077 [Trichosporon asahii var. asahii CBS 8904]